jgi:SsrA-binding protein
MKTLATNKRASFDYELLARYEAGLVLLGHEVKSVKTGHLSLKGSFVTTQGGNMYLTNAFIPPYPFAGKLKNYEPTRPRRLLLKKSETRSLTGKIRIAGLTIVPLRVYTKRQLLKLEFAIGKGKKSFDKRQSIAKQEAKRRIEKTLRTEK